MPVKLAYKDLEEAVWLERSEKITKKNISTVMTSMNLAQVVLILMNILKNVLGGGGGYTPPTEEELAEQQAQQRANRISQGYGGGGGSGIGGIGFILRY